MKARHVVTIAVIVLAIASIIAVTLLASNTAAAHDDQQIEQVTVITVRCRLPWQPALMIMPDGTRKWTCMYIWRGR